MSIIGARGCTLATVVSCLLVFLGCRVESSDTRRSLMLMFDVSGSATDELRAKYLEWARSLVGSEDDVTTLKAGDVLIFGRVGQGSLSQSDMPKITMPTRSESANPLLAEANTRKAVAGARSRLEQFFAQASQNPAPRSEILDALHVASQVLQALDRPRKILVVFSDMIEESQRLDLSKVDLSRDGIDSIIERERAAGYLPDLSGVEVYLAGAGAGDYARKLGAERLLAIQQFWVRYLDATGASFDRRQYLPTFLGID